MKLNWRECTMQEAIKFASGKTVNETFDRFEEDLNLDCDWAVEAFTDGTAIACLSSMSGPLSDTTPDVDIEPPDWQIGET